jgi:hypothetical protein
MCGVLRSTVGRGAGIRRRRFSKVGSTEEEKHAYNASTLGGLLPAGGVDPTVVGVLARRKPVLCNPPNGLASAMPIFLQVR